MRRKAGGDGSNQFSNGDKLSPLLKTTESIANELGITERTLQRRKQIAKNIDESVKSAIADTEIADNQNELLELARTDKQTQKKIVKKIKSGKAKTVKDAKSEIKKEERKKERWAVETETKTDEMSRYLMKQVASVMCEHPQNSKSGSQNSQIPLENASNSF